MASSPVVSGPGPSWVWGRGSRSASLRKQHPGHGVGCLLLSTRHPALPVSQDCLRACQEQIEALLEASLRQAQQQSLDPKAAEEEEEEEVDLACTPTDVRDVNI